MVLLTLFSWALLREGRLFPSTESLMEQLSQHDPAFFLGLQIVGKQMKNNRALRPKGQDDYGG